MAITSKKIWMPTRGCWDSYPISDDDVEDMMIAMTNDPIEGLLVLYNSYHQLTRVGSPGTKKSPKPMARAIVLSTRHRETGVLHI